LILFVIYFFFQAEDGIRAFHVTGVQTCALPISTAVLVTARDIIFFWVARMIFMGLEFMGEKPFHEVLIHGLVLDKDGKKMSKSRSEERRVGKECRSRWSRKN